MDYQDVFPAILAYEDDGLAPREELELFSKLIETGVAFSLQGSYGRKAVWFMENGYILPNGEITGAGLAVFGEEDPEVERTRHTYVFSDDEQRPEFRLGSDRRDMGRGPRR
jgi:hypothetical protein